MVSLTRAQLAKREAFHARILQEIEQNPGIESWVLAEKFRINGHSFGSLLGYFVKIGRITSTRETHAGPRRLYSIPPDRRPPPPEPVAVPERVYPSKIPVTADDLDWHSRCQRMAVRRTVINTMRARV